MSMDRKRRNTSSPETESPPSKRSRQSTDDEYDSSSDDEPGQHEQPRIDATYGQKGAFPGLGGDDDELFYGPANDGIEYLRMVRSEARSVPRLLVASKSEQNKVETNTNDNAGGFFDEDAYIGISRPEPARADSSEDDVQDEYYRALLLRFDLIRATLKCTPPLEAISALPATRPISFPRDSKKARSAWRRILVTAEPQMVQLACMDMNTTLGVIGLLAGMLPQVAKKRDVTQIRNIGAWCWGCLGRCLDVGQFSSDEVSDLRELGKAAVAGLVSVRDGLDVGAGYGDEDHASDGSEGSEDGEVMDYEGGGGGGGDSIAATPATDPAKAELTIESHGITSSEAEELERAKQRLRSSLLGSKDDNADPDHEEGQIMELSQEEDSAAGFDTQLRAVLDMIITVVGEKYGQRDLLEFRDIWEEAADS